MSASHASGHCCSGVSAGVKSCLDCAQVRECKSHELLVRPARNTAFCCWTMASGRAVSSCRPWWDLTTYVTRIPLHDGHGEMRFMVLSGRRMFDFVDSLVRRCDSTVRRSWEWGCTMIMVMMMFLYFVPKSRRNIPGLIGRHTGSCT